MKGAVWIACLVLSVPIAQTGADAAALGIVKSSGAVSDPLGDTLPLRVPGALVDYSVTITNPLANAGTAVSGVVYSDPIPAKTMLYVADLAAAGQGPVAFTNGLSALAYSYSGLASTSDALDFSSDNGLTWNYAPIPDSNGCDGSVTNIRVRLSGNQTAGSSFTLRFRVRVN